MTKLHHATAVLLVFGVGGAALAEAPAPQEIALPSGRVVEVQDVITNAPGSEGATARFRFVVEGLTPDEDWSEDMMVLCETHALPLVSGMIPAPQQIVISLASAPVPFGEPAPDTVQFFEAFAPEGQACIWEMF